METKPYAISLDRNPSVSTTVIPGHFTTSNAHVNYYLDLSKMKSNASVAREVARELAVAYLSNSIVETIVCMENTKVIGAYLAEELLQHGMTSVNSGGEIHVVTPMSNINGKLVFYDSELEWITNKNVLLLTASVSSGRTLDSALECLAYYRGIIAGISALFLVTPSRLEKEVHALFTSDDLPEYTISCPSQCNMCKAGMKLDAIISSEGYTKISSE